RSARFAAPFAISGALVTAPVSGQERKPAAANAGTTAALERSLVDETTLDAVLRVALANNPDLTEARERARADRESAPAAARLPDPEFEYQLWAQPLARPLALDEAQMHMFGLRQSIPAPGSLGARADAASEQAKVTGETRRAREQDLVLRVRRAYAQYYRADREFRVHLDHMRLMEQVLDVARAGYQGGRGSQQDVLRAAVSISRLHNDVAVVDGERRTARGLLNTLMARPVEAPLGPPAALQPAEVELRAAELERSLADRPELVAAESAARAREHELDAARSIQRWPSFMVGVQYMFMPTMMEDKHNYGVMLSMSLPWLNPRYGEEVRAAEARVSAERSALSSSRAAARYELFEAFERLKAARESLAIIDRDVLPQAAQSVEIAQAAYRGGQGDSLALLDSLKSLLDVRIERERALTRVDGALADVERAAGRPLRSGATGGAPR
ncbi:MAG TPA: TolC family protein, partial [Polyangiaceae bacterium]